MTYLIETATGGIHKINILSNHIDTDKDMKIAIGSGEFAFDGVECWWAFSTAAAASGRVIAYTIT